MAAIWMSPSTVAQSIRGIVYDPSGAVVARAEVMLMQDYFRLKRMTGDEDGSFMFSDLVPGRYQVQIKKPMFSLFQQTVEVKEQGEEVLYAVLPLGRMSDGMRINARLAPTARRNRLPTQREIRAGGKVEPSKILKFQMPEYPPGPDARGVEGDVVLCATIKADGSVAGPIVISSPDPEFDADSIAAVKNWRYSPMKLNGQPVDAQVIITLQFRLQ